MPINLENIDSILQNANLADSLDSTDRDKIADKVIRIFDEDKRSRHEWEEQHDEWMKLALQIMEERSFPFKGSANVKYPLLTTSAIQFHARSYPTLINGPNIVRAVIIGEDPEELKARRAERISKHMSYQFMNQIECWDEDMDKALFALPILGTIFKKVYYDSEKGYNTSELVYPKDLVVNFWAKDLESAYSKTHVILLAKNKIRERVKAGLFTNYDFDAVNPEMTEDQRKTIENQGLSVSANQEYRPLMLLEQHTWHDLDGDGYEEPYIITVDYKARKLLRITPRFQKDGVVSGEDGIISIKPDEMFIKYSFIPNPDGGFYDLGFGALLGPLNMAVNTLLNQLVDSGTINNLQSGFIARGIRMKAGEARLQPGEWKFIQSSGDDLKKGIFPLPTKEPSDTLFKLLGTMVESGDKLASVAEIFVGKMPGQNTPATTTMATIEQGMKVFTAIYKRIYRSLSKEYRRMYRLNAIYLPVKEYFQVLDSPELEQTGQSDYLPKDTDVYPFADPAAASETLRLTKAQALLELLPLGLNKEEVVRRVLEAQDQPEIEKLMQGGEAPPDPKMMEAQMKMQMEQMKGQIAQQKAQLDAQAKQMDIQIKGIELQFKEKELQMKQKEAQINLMTKAATSQMDMQNKDAQNKLTLRQKDEQFKQQQAMKKAKDKEANANKSSNKR